MVRHLHTHTHTLNISFSFTRITALPALKENLLHTFLLQDKSQRPGGLSSWREQQCFRLYEKWILPPTPEQWEAQWKGSPHRPPASQGSKKSCWLEIWLKTTGSSKKKTFFWGIYFTLKFGSTLPFTITYAITVLIYNIVTFQTFG